MRSCCASPPAAQRCWSGRLYRSLARLGPLARWPRRWRRAVTAAVGGPVRAAADTPSPLGGPRLVLACQPPGGALLAGRGGSRSLSRSGTASQRSGPRTGQCSHAPTDAARLDCPRWPLGCQASLPCPPWARQRGAPCLPHPPPRGHKARHRLRPCHRSLFPARLGQCSSLAGSFCQGYPRFARRCAALTAPAWPLSSAIAWSEKCRAAGQGRLQQGQRR